MNKTSPVAANTKSMTFRRSKTRTSDKIVPILLGLCAMLSVFTTIGIVYTLLQESVIFFKEVPVWSFLTGTTWSPILPPKNSACALAGRHIADYRHCDHFRSAYRLGMRYLSQ